jgi:glutamyl-tRNA reductase
MAIEFFVLGANHATAPIDLRERISLSPLQQEKLMAQLSCRFAAPEAAVICTCNRVEIYGVSSDAPSKDQLLELLGEVTGISALDSSVFYFHRGQRAVEHLFRVASSLDSQIIGETHILGQVKESYQKSIQVGAAGKWLNIFFQKSFQVAKRVRNETSITALPVSTGSCAVALANRVVENLEGRKLLVVGAGETGRTVARHFSKRGVELTVSNRTRAIAESLAAELGGKVVDFDQWRSALVHSDIAVFATDSREPLLNNDHAAKVAQLRRNRPLLILDLSMPRNVDPGIDRLESVFVYDIDSVQTLVEAHYSVRVSEAERAQKIIAAAAQEAWEKLTSRDCVPQTVLTAKMLLTD